jgi:hypothetical protein
MSTTQLIHTSSLQLEDGPARKKSAVVPAFSVGDEAAKRVNGRIVGVGVYVNISHKIQGREGDAAIPIYEVPLMRRMYERDGGTITLRPNWVPSIPRHRLLTDALFDDKNTNEAESIGELNRLRRTYLLKNSGSAVDLMAEVYGATKAEQAKNLQKGMKAIFEGWMDLYLKAKGRVNEKRPDLEQQVLSLFPSDETVTQRIYDKTLEAWMLELTGLEITINELEDLVNLVDPRSKGLDDYLLEGIDDSRPQIATLVRDEVIVGKGTAKPEAAEPQKPAASVPQAVREEEPSLEDAMRELEGGNAEDPIEKSERIQDALIKEGIPESVAMDVATLNMEPAGIPDSVLEQIPGIRKAAATYKKIRKIVEFASKQPAVQPA